MKAALVAAERGHKVTIYEKNDFLGGQLKHADFGSFTWPLKDYRDYLIRQVKKLGIDVLLSTKATPEMIKAKGYEAVLVAVGAEPIIPDISGGNMSNVRTPITVFGNEKALGKNVAIVGGGEMLDEDMVIGVSTGIYLAQSGHNVTLLTSRKEVVTTFTQHYPEYIVALYQKLKNFTPVTDATVTRIAEGQVTYKDAKGNENTILADSVVVSVGRQARRDEALRFYGSANRVINLGDCSDEGGNIQRSVRSAYFAASQI
jgi:NADPH-dependent 2,4-dienoyl-CoA reductase/sulfur reductase-like enzyme